MSTDRRIGYLALVHATANMGARRLTTFIVALALLAGCGERTADPDGNTLPAVNTLPHEWTRLEPGGRTACSDGSAYSFFVRPVSGDRLLVWFQGGGACESGEHCSRFVDPTFKPVVGPREQQRDGIFDLANTENPFRDYDMVVVPYCTGDVHLGDAVTTYDVPATDSTAAGTLEFHHNGYANAMAVLDWVFANYRAPLTIFVSGSSAGSIASPFYAGIIADEYADARVVQLGDASGAYRPPRLDSTLARWGTAGVLARHAGFRDVAIDSLTFEHLYAAAAAHHPSMKMAQYDAAADQTQTYFVGESMGEEPFDLPALIDATHQDIRRSVPGYRSYMSGGRDHTVLGVPWFYTFRTGSWRIRDWVAALAAGEEVPDVRCEDCAYAGLWLTIDDHRVLQLADSLLSSPDRWQPHDDRDCRDDFADRKWSLACAMRAASQATPGNPNRRAAVDRLRAIISSREPDIQDAQLPRFNNRPGVRFADIRHLLALATASVDSALASQAAGR